jgi:catechol 2,3-dioxygenase-like lactoylglutathione lyase family enzyme
MDNAPFFHVGILVADIDAAIDRFSKVFGLTFTDVGGMPVTLHGSEQSEVTMRAAYSREGPPHIELVEGQGDGIFSLRHGEGVHHIGVWSPEFSAYDPGRCLPVSLRVNMMPGDPSMWLSDPTDLHGTRIEFVDERGRDQLEAWIKGSPPG